MSLLLKTWNISKSMPIEKLLSICKIHKKPYLQKRFKTNWLDDFVGRTPAQVQPYMKLLRIQKPTGTWLIYWPSTWGIAVAAAPGTFPDPYTLLLFGAGALVMRGAGCTINDMIDKDLDAKVWRTADRPLVCGVISMPQAITFLAAQLSVALAILLQLNWYSVILGASSLCLIVIYPLMKRITYWPQVTLGITLNWGNLLGYSAVKGCVDWDVCLPLYTAAVFWTIIYDTIYAHQDISDDLAVGIYSTAILFEGNTKYWLSAFAGVVTSGLVTTGVATEQLWPYYSAVTFISSHLAWQIYTLNIKNSADCGKKFASNAPIGFILFCGLLFSNLLKTKCEDEQLLTQQSCL